MKPGEQPGGLAGVMSNPPSFVCSLNQLALCLRSYSQQLTCLMVVVSGDCPSYSLIVVLLQYMA